MNLIKKKDNQQVLFMKLSALGITEEISSAAAEADLKEYSIGRITREHRERYVVSDGEKDYEAEITGNLRYTARSASEFPAVGDWVVIKIYNDDQAIIHRILPRRSVLARQAPGKTGEEQVISANIDVAFIVQALNNNFSINRLERYLVICNDAGIEPVLVLTKTDLMTEEEIRVAAGMLEKREKKVKYFLLSNITLKGFNDILDFIEKGKTYCVIGSSGVGKSTLINNLLERDVLKTAPVSNSTNKGKHVTSHRELFVLGNGGIVIDNPGMRELGIADSSDGISTTFADIEELARKCKFQDCSHLNEKGCAVTGAVEMGIIDRESYLNYIRMVKEQERFRTSVAEKRRREKIFGRIIKNYHKMRKREDE